MPKLIARPPQAEIIAYAKAGYTCGQTAAKFEVPYSFCHRVLRLSGVFVKTKGALSDQQKAEIIAFAKAGHTATETAAKFGITYDTCRPLLQKAGVFVEARTKKDQAVALAKAGRNCAQITVELGISYSFCSKVLKAAGLFVKSAPRPKAPKPKAPKPQPRPRKSRSSFFQRIAAKAKARREEMAAFYLAGHSIEQTAARFEILPKSCLCALKKIGVIRRKPKSTSDKICTCCGIRPKAKGLRFLCEICYTENTYRPFNSNEV